VKPVIWPYAKLSDGSWTIPEGVIHKTWERLVELNRVDATWYDGSVQDEKDFIEFLQDPYIFPVLVVDANELRLWLLAWLSDIQRGSARGHFCYLDRYNMNVTKMLLNYWAKIASLRVIIGITPESYQLVLKIIQKSGFQILGTIPQICDMYYEGRLEGGVISYYLTKEGDDNGGQEYG